MAVGVVRSFGRGLSLGEGGGKQTPCTSPYPQVVQEAGCALGQTHSHSPTGSAAALKLLGTRNFPFSLQVSTLVG